MFIYWMKLDIKLKITNTKMKASLIQFRCDSILIFHPLHSIITCKTIFHSTLKGKKEYLHNGKNNIARVMRYLNLKFKEKFFFSLKAQVSKSTNFTFFIMNKGKKEPSERNSSPAYSQLDTLISNLMKYIA